MRVALFGKGSATGVLRAALLDDGFTVARFSDFRADVRQSALNALAFADVVVLCDQSPLCLFAAGVLYGQEPDHGLRAPAVFTIGWSSLSGDKVDNARQAFAALASAGGFGVTSQRGRSSA